jgi:hypothetical protein
MHDHTFLRWLEPAAGGLLVFLALLDLFLTVLYARAGAGFISDRVARSTWSFFYMLSKAFRKRQATVLSLSGSFIVVVLIATWATTLTLGSALILHPYLGTSVRSSDKDSTSTDFLTALYAGGSSMSLVGSSDYSAKTTSFRMVYLFNSLLGMSVMSLALTYVMQIYNALQDRNTFGLKVDQMSSRTGDAAALIKALGQNNDFSAGYTNLGNMADAISAIREAHDFYPVLFYFRYPKARYSASRTTLMALDTVSLLRSAIPDGGKNGWVKQAASVSQLWEGGMSLLRTLEQTFLPGETLGEPEAPSPEDRDQWTRRYRKAVATMREGGIETVPNEDGAEAYIAMRTCWNRDVMRLAEYMAWRMGDIDPATAK